MADSLKQKAVKGLAWNTVNTISNRVVTFLIGLVLARLLCPADYGLTAMIGVFTSVLGIFTDGGLSAALVRKENRTESDMATVFWYNLVACWTLYAILFVAAPYIADFYDVPILKDITRISSLGLIVSPFGGIQSMLLQTRLDFKTPAIISLITNIISGLLAIFLAYRGYGVWALVVQGLVATTMSVAANLYVVRWLPKTRFSTSSFKELFGFASGMIGAQVAGRIYDNIAPLVIGKYYSPAQLGVYNRAIGWAQLPSTTFVVTLHSVAFPTLSKIQDDLPRLAHNYRKMIRLASFVSMPMMVGLASVASPLTLFVLTEKWAESIPLLQVICFSFVLMSANTLNESLLLVLGRSDLYFKLSVLNNCINLAGMAVTLPFGLVAFCYGQVTTTVIRFIIKTVATQKLINVGFSKQAGDILPIFFNSCVMGLICLLVQMPFESNGVKLLVAIPIGALYYLASSYLLYRGDMMETVNMVNVIRGKK